MMFGNVTDENRNYVTAVTVSLFLHMLIFVQFMNNSSNSSAQAPEYAPRISVNMLPPPIQTPQLVKQETPPPKPRPRFETKPTPEPELKKAAEPKPEPKKAVEPKSEPTPVPAVVHERIAAPRVVDTIQRETANRTAIVKTHYLNNMLTYIEGHKYYPRAARRRGLEGSIKVSFQLLNNGDINDLKASGGPLVLRKAAEEAVARSLPLPAPPTEVNCPLQVSYAMQFHLN